jgi:hypothetical protein
MKGLDLNSEFAEDLNDKSKIISDYHLVKVCKIRQGEQTCKYICLTASGYICTKKTKLKKVVNDMVKKRIIKADKDNCSGI